MRLLSGHILSEMNHILPLANLDLNKKSGKETPGSLLTGVVRRKWEGRD